LQIIVQLMMYN